MGDVARPMLAEVLAAITPETYVPAWEAVAPRVRLALDAVLLSVPSGTEVRPGGARWEWTVTDPAEAQERLVSRGLLPEGWCGDARRGWHCEECGGEGYQRPTDDTNTDPYTGGGVWRCRACGSSSAGRGLLDCATTIPDLVAVTSLGWPAIQRAEELGPAACAALRGYGCPQPERVVWRVGERRSRRGQEVPLAWWAREGGAKISMADVLSVDGILYPAKGPETWQHATRELWLSDLALDAITADAVRIVVPPVGGVR